MNEEIRKALRDMGHDDPATIRVDGHFIDDAIVGVTAEGRVIYDFNKGVQTLMRLGFNEDQAAEQMAFVATATLSAGDTAPIIMHPIWM